MFLKLFLFHIAAYPCQWLNLLKQMLQLLSRAIGVIDKKPESENLEKIVGGIRARISEFPYQLSVRLYGGHFCGASIIHHQWAISAAHCFPTYIIPKHVRVHSGTDEIRRNGFQHKVELLIIHKDFDTSLSFSSALINDIALIKVKPEFSDIVNRRMSIPLNTEESNIIAGAMGVISGWGTLQESSSILPNFLRKAKLPIVSRRTCRNSLGYVIPRQQICAGFKQGGIDSCQGDSGGPLVINGKLFGITSWGIGCGRPNYPGVYTNVAFYNGWINKNMKM